MGCVIALSGCYGLKSGDDRADGGADIGAADLAGLDSDGPEPLVDLGNDTDAGPDVDAGPPLDGGPPLTGVRATIFYVDPDTSTRRALPTPDVGAAATSAAGSGRAPNLACLEMRPRPSESGTVINVVATLRDYESGDPVDGVVVQFLRDNLPRSSADGGFDCPAASCVTLTSGMGGVLPAALDASESWHAYFARGALGGTPATTRVDTLAYNRFSNSAVDATVVSQSILDVSSMALEITRQTGTAWVSGTVYDCDDMPVRGCVVRMFAEGPDATTDADDTLITDSDTRTGPAYGYSDGDDMPSAEQLYTNVNGTYVGSNIPVATPLRVEAWCSFGPLSAPMPVLLSCERIGAFPDGATLLDLRSLRSDITGCTP